MSVKARMYMVLIIALMGMSALLVVNLVGSGMIENAKNIELLSLESEVQMLQARRNEKDFFSRKDIKYVKVVDELVAANRKTLGAIAELDSDFAKPAQQAEDLFMKYGKAFDLAAEGVIAMGLSETEGLEGTLRTAIHEAETIIKEQNSDTLMAAMLMLRRREKDFMLRGDTKYLEKFKADMSAMIGKVEGAAQISGGQRAKILELLKHYEDSFEAFVVQHQAVEQDIKVFSGHVHDLEPVIEAITVMGKAKMDSTITNVNRVVFIIEIAVGVILFVVVVPVIRSIVAPLEALRRYSHAVAEGRSEQCDSAGFPDELRSLHADLSSMVVKLQESMAEAESKSQQATANSEKATAAMEEARQKENHVVEMLEIMQAAADQAAGIADRLSASSSQLARQSDEMRQGAEVQSQRVAETATAMEEMNATVMDVARNSADAAGSAEKSRGQAQAGQSEVEDTIAAISEVQASNLELSSVMDDLAAQADAIGSVMGIISDIADQTNLLALNAAIEAARAGDAGRGLAVVADEVRKLAEKTMEATSEVGQAINGIQESVRSSVGKREVTETALNRTTERARKAGEILGEIVDLVDHSTSMAHGIATAAEEQSSTSEEITRTIEDINRISHETSEGVTRSALAIQEIASLADELVVVIENLKRAK